MAISQMVEPTGKGVFVQGTAQTGFAFLWKLGYDFFVNKKIMIPSFPRGEQFNLCF